MDLRLRIGLTCTTLRALPVAFLNLRFPKLIVPQFVSCSHGRAQRQRRGGFSQKFGKRNGGIGGDADNDEGEAPVDEEEGEGGRHAAGADQVTILLLRRGVKLDHAGFCFTNPR